MQPQPRQTYLGKANSTGYPTHHIAHRIASLFSTLLGSTNNAMVHGSQRIGAAPSPSAHIASHPMSSRPMSSHLALPTGILAYTSTQRSNLQCPYPSPCRMGHSPPPTSPRLGHYLILFQLLFFIFISSFYLPVLLLCALSVCAATHDPSSLSVARLASPPKLLHILLVRRHPVPAVV